MIKFERVEVTPKLAAQWLEKNHPDNRPPKSSRIPMYARDMLTGRWNSDTGETVKFDQHGYLVDGQNRLSALVLAGQTDRNVVIPMDVARGLPGEAARVLDSGASRTFGDALHWEGVKDRNRVSSVVRWAIHWDVQNYMAGGQFSPTNAEMWDRYRKEADAFDSATRRGSDAMRAGLGMAAAAGMAHYLFRRINAEAAEMFMDHFVSGVGLHYGSPILVLRNRLARTKLDRLSRQEQLALMIKGWNQWRAGRTVNAILLPKGKLTNVNFPKPEEA